MAIILNLETATTNCSVSISRNGVLLGIREENTASYSHSEQLHLFIEQLLSTASLSVNDLDAIAVSQGPGSYTGLRIGVSAAKGLSFSLDVPLIAVSTLESLAHQLKVSSGYIIPLLDARRMEVYSAVFDHAYNMVRPVDAEIITSEAFKEYVQKDKVYLLGNGAPKCREILQHPNFSFAPAMVPSAKEMSQLSYQKYKKEQFEDVAYFEPYYLKQFMSKPMQP